MFWLSVKYTLFQCTELALFTCRLSSYADPVKSQAAGRVREEEENGVETVDDNADGEGDEDGKILNIDYVSSLPVRTTNGMKIMSPVIVDVVDHLLR